MTKLDPDKIAKALGASSYEKVGSNGRSGYFGALRLANEIWRRKQDKLECNQDSECLVQKFFEEQQNLPPSLRSNAAMISCPCKRCNPYTL